MVSYSRPSCYSGNMGQCHFFGGGGGSKFGLHVHMGQTSESESDPLKGVALDGDESLWFKGQSRLLQHLPDYCVLHHVRVCAQETI